MYLKMLSSSGTNWASSCSASSPKHASKPQKTNSLSLLCPSHCSAHFPQPQTLSKSNSLPCSAQNHLPIAPLVSDVFPSSLSPPFSHFIFFLCFNSLSRKPFLSVHSTVPFTPLSYSSPMVFQDPSHHFPSPRKMIGCSSKRYSAHPHPFLLFPAGFSSSSLPFLNGLLLLTKTSSSGF